MIIGKLFGKRELRTVLVGAATTGLMALGGAAWAYWTDAATVTTTGTITAATTVPMPVLTCPNPPSGQNTVANWSMPAGYQATNWRVVMTYDTPGSWQSQAGTPTSNIWVMDSAARSGTWKWNDSGIVSNTQGIWGIKQPTVAQLPLGQTQSNSGTLTVYARIGNWESAPATATWHINYATTCDVTVPLLGCMSSSVKVAQLDCTVTATS